MRGACQRSIGPNVEPVEFEAVESGASIEDLQRLGCADRAELLQISDFFGDLQEEERKADFFPGDLIKLTDYRDLQEIERLAQLVVIFRAGPVDELLPAVKDQRSPAAFSPNLS